MVMIVIVIRKVKMAMIVISGDNCDSDKDGEDGDDPN